MTGRGFACISCQMRARTTPGRISIPQQALSYLACMRSACIEMNLGLYPSLTTSDEAFKILRPGLILETSLKYELIVRINWWFDINLNPLKTLASRSCR